MSSQRSMVFLKRERQRLLERLIRMTFLVDLLKLRSFEIAALYARARGDDGLGSASSIARISAKCHTTEAEAADWIAVGEAILKTPRGGSAVT